MGATGFRTHVQVAPPADFHRPSRNFDTPIGIFEGQSDIGSAVVPGSASYDASTKQYTINSAGYNVWYTRDEFRYLWKKMSGDVSLAADITYPDPNGYGDRKAVLVIRQDLDDDSKEAIAALHGVGMIHLAQRPEKDVRVKDMEYRIGGRGGLPGGASPTASSASCQAHRHRKARRLLRALRQPGRRTDAPVRPAHQSAYRRALLRRHRLLLAPAGQVRYGGALECRAGELRRQGPLTVFGPTEANEGNEERGRHCLQGTAPAVRSRRRSGSSVPRVEEVTQRFPFLPDRLKSHGQRENGE